MGRQRVPAEARKYKTPVERRTQIIEAAYKIASDKGLGKVTFAAVARDVGVTAPLIYSHFDNVSALREYMLVEAVARKNVEVVADAIELQMDTAQVPPGMLSKAQRLLEAA